MNFVARSKQYCAGLWSDHNYRMSIAMLVITLLWLSSGAFKGEAQATPLAVQKPEALFNVQARYMDAQHYQPMVFVRGRSEADKKVLLRAELDGRVIATPAIEGGRVKKGDVICELALEDRQVRVQEAESQLRQAQIEYSGSQKLRSGGYQSDAALASAKASLDAAKASLKSRQLDLANVKIQAPFSGLLETHHVDVGGYLKSGDTCAELLALNPLVIRGQVSESEVIQLKLASPAKVQFLNGAQYDGRVSYIGADSDPVTRTYRVDVELDNSDFRLRSGLTAQVTIPVQDLMAHTISPSILSLDDNGELGVKVLDENHRVMSYHVDIIGDHQEGVWVTGLPEKILLITRGQEYVSAGTQVRVTLDASKKPTNTKSVVVNPPSAEVLSNSELSEKKAAL